MWNQSVYEAIEKELEKNNIEEDVDEFMLELAECLEESEIMDKEVSKTETYGKIQVMVTGICTLQEEEVEVLIKQIKIGKNEFEINDYLL